VVSLTSPAPPFGEADLSNCELEQIHLAGSIQPHGALLVVCEPELVVAQASANAASVLGIDHNVLGRSLEELGGNIGQRVTGVPAGLARPHPGGR
jgi:chemotaxis family two-component system sensor kinase Cph1